MVSVKLAQLISITVFASTCMNIQAGTLTTRTIEIPKTSDTSTVALDPSSGKPVGLSENLITGESKALRVEGSPGSSNGSKGKNINGAKQKKTRSLASNKRSSRTSLSRRDQQSTSVTPPKIKEVVSGTQETGRKHGAKKSAMGKRSISSANSPEAPAVARPALVPEVPLRRRLESSSETENEAKPKKTRPMTPRPKLTKRKENEATSTKLTEGQETKEVPKKGGLRSFLKNVVSGGDGVVTGANDKGKGTTSQKPDGDTGKLSPPPPPKVHNDD
ncbi:hypothetical protein PtA15_13A330 [Puccinia triticina]|uniref:Uncharacterized protein n=1 Tax=Puccinia triticina TaxID=208348 RepID=A0ABY7D217_9BASI|nr:uncharacterized protein PtA15_13A330 [Puccinia triticina]WAQ90930.1 hypothetical protein PtA15_13A330 [Puccinia triticina]WAR61116.1 hypothetical protein PtB15_13B368 [Puccinia triticina]